MISVYIAAPYPCREEATTLAARLAAYGVTCTARWITDGASAELNDEWARNDLADVLAADCLIAINTPAWSDKGSGGRHVEYGYALAHQKPIILYGQRTHIFHHLSTVVRVDSFQELLGALTNVSVAV